MGNEENGLQPIFSHVEPVLAVQDVAETIAYWQDVLGFPTNGHGANHQTLELFRGKKHLFSFL